MAKSLLSRAVSGIFLATLALSFPSISSAQKVTVQDLKGRTVTLAKPASRILIDDGRYLIALSLIHPDPVSIIAAWPRDINRVGALTYQRYLEKFPKIADIPQVASSASTFSLEKVLAVKPDVAVVSLGPGPSDADVKRCEAAGIPVVFIDFFTHPFENLERSLTILGEISGRQAQTKAFIDFRKQHMNAITQKVKTAKENPKVFLEVHAGMSGECCNAPGKGNIGDYINVVGGHNISADILPSTYGKVNIEYVISQNPKVYIATGGPHLEKTGGLVVGPGYTPDRSRASLQKILQRPGFASLSAAKSGNVHGLSHQLLNSPLDILAVEALAKWIHPDLFQNIDPAKTMAEINERFLAVPIDGTNWINLR